MGPMAREGHLPFHGYRIYFRIVGTNNGSGRLPLLCLHGGPGASWDYFEPLERLANDGRQIVFYDQLGGGDSSVPSDPSIHTIALFLEELAEVRRTLQLDRVHLLGHSWGGMLAMEYALTQPPGLASLILGNTAASMAEWVAEMRRLVSQLPLEMQEAISRHEAEGTTDSPEYMEACREFSRRHLTRRLNPRPDCLTRMAQKPGELVYHAMWGPSEWHVTGTLRDWDVSTRLSLITVPTLLIGGRYDEATPAVMETMHRGIAGSQLFMFGHSGHVPHLEETELYLHVLGAFLERVEQPQSAT